MRIMYDSITAADIPANAVMVAGYIDGNWAWAPQDWNRWPESTVKLRITVSAAVNDGHILDVEQGDATPDQCPGWIKMRQAAGLARPTIYCSKSVVPSVQAACKGLTYDIWDADYTQGYKPRVDAGCVATQFIDPPASGGHYDLSQVLDTWYPSTPTGEVDLTPEQEQWLKDLHDTFIGNPPQPGVDWLAYSRTLYEAVDQIRTALIENPADTSANYLAWSRDVTAKLNEILAQAPPQSSPTNLTLELTGTAKPA